MAPSRRCSRTARAKGTGRNAVSHYDCLSLEKLAALPISDLTADDCVLFLWAVDPLLDKALHLMRAWGFDYKTVAFYWVKQNAKSDGFFTGLGYRTRANPEQCLLGTRGSPRRLGKDVRKLVIDRRREHSRKPDQVRELIERLVGGPYLELFARETKRGWDCWGDQVGLFNTEPVQTRRQPSRLTDAHEACSTIGE